MNYNPEEWAADGKIIEHSEVDGHGSQWGNKYLALTAEQLEALKQGKVIETEINGEYGIFICVQPS